MDVCLTAYNKTVESYFHIPASGKWENKDILRVISWIFGGAVVMGLALLLGQIAACFAKLCCKVKKQEETAEVTQTSQVARGIIAPAAELPQASSPPADPAPVTTAIAITIDPPPVLTASPAIKTAPRSSSPAFPQTPIRPLLPPRTSRATPSTPVASPTATDPRVEKYKFLVFQTPDYSGPPIEYIYTNPNKTFTYGKERIVRHPTVRLVQQFALGTVRHLEKLEKQGTALSPQQRVQREYYKNMALQAEMYEKHYKKDWATCNQFRDLSHAHGFRNASEYNIAALINARKQSLMIKLDALSAACIDLLAARGIDIYSGTIEEYEIFSFTRTGAFYNEANGWYSLRFLEGLKGLSPEAQQKQLREKGAEVVGAIKELLPELKQCKWDGSLQGVISVIEGGIKACKSTFMEKASKSKNVAMDKDLALLKTKWQKLTSAHYALCQLQQIYSNPGSLSAIIDARLLIFKIKFLQLLHIQIKDHPECFKDGVFRMLHLGLLNREESDLTQHGWRHDESVAMEDMWTMFCYFNGYTISFTSEVELVVEDATSKQLRVPLTDAPKGYRGEIVQLLPIFVNISPQKHTKNDGIQKTINQHALTLFAQGNLLSSPAYQLLDGFMKQGFGKFIGKDLKKFKKLKTYDFISQLGMALIEAGFAFSEGCSSCKDRGGTVAALIILLMLAKYCKMSEKERKAHASGILDPGMPLSLVIDENRNTDAEVAPKVNSLAVPEMPRRVHKRGLSQLIESRLTSKDDQPDAHLVKWLEAFRLDYL